VLERVGSESDRARRARAIIDHQVTHMTRLVGDLLDVSRIQRNKIELSRERLDLAALTERTVEIHRDVFTARGIELTAALPGRPVWVDGDGVRLAQVLGNLLHNAAKFTSTRGRVSVELAEEGREAVLRVRDSGAGIPAEMLARIFEPFTQGEQGLDRGGGGLGLGLALAKGLVGLHEGTIRAYSEGPGRGAEFVVRLPVDTAAFREGPRPEEAVRSPPRRVLLIEDNLDAAESLKEALALDGHEVEVAHDGPEGVEKAHAIAPEIVLCDIGLPGMDGYEVARALRGDEALDATALVALTGYAQAEDRQKALDAGFDGHLTKPPDLDALERLLATLPARRAA
jgi:two-component system CheB/CheR fusion protein